MMDPALSLICEALETSSGSKLLIADENLDCNHLLALQGLEDLSLLSNRYDVYLSAQQSNIPCYFNDMDLKKLGKFDTIAYRISKEKAIVHHVINQAAHHLNDQGTFIFCGHKNEGMKTYISKGEAYFGNKADVSKGERQMKLAQLTLSQMGEPLDDRQYEAITSIGSTYSLELFSKPGQYGWNKIDQGSKMLVHALEQHIKEYSDAPKHFLDLGCGYGYLSLSAWALGAKHITATDNNAAALRCAEYNFNHHKINGEVITDHCAASIHHQYNMVLCNPPFHKGFETDTDLTEKFLKSAKHHLKTSGHALFVVNQFIPLETLAATHFKSIDLLEKDHGFKVIRLSS